MADTAEFLKSDEVKTNAEGLKQAFLVLTDDATVNMKTMKESHDTTVHTVIMGGDKDKIAKLHEVCKKQNQGPWKNRDQVQ